VKSVNIIPKKSKKNFKQVIDSIGYAKILGELEITGYKNGKAFHYDKSHNVVTIWAKHATMHLLTGDSFSSIGEQRSFNQNDHLGQGDERPGNGSVFDFSGEGINSDGTLLSGQQFFSNNINPNFDIDSKYTKSSSDISQTNLIHPYFPTKMLFGTGFEFDNWQEIVDFSERYEEVYREEGWEDIFDQNISDQNNDYSNKYSNSVLSKRRSINDVFSRSLTIEPLENDFAISGAIKNGTYTNSDSQRFNSEGSDLRTENVNNNEFLKKEFRGIGKPSFIYSNRSLGKLDTSSEIFLSADSNENIVDVIENKVTFTVVMPEQTGNEAGIFYPYNGYILKEAGLFCDARFILNNTEPASSDEDYDNFRKMPYGIMIAKRNIAPIQKSHNVSIAARWTLYF
jgi:hypothetical protein